MHKPTTFIFLLFLVFLAGCSTSARQLYETEMDKPAISDLELTSPLIKIVDQTEIGKKNDLFDQEGLQTGTVIVKRRYYAASGAQCYNYHWISASTTSIAKIPELNTLCRETSGAWRKVRILLNLESLM